VSLIVTKKDNWLKRKSKIQGVLVRLKKQSFRVDGSWVLFKKNNIVLLKKRLTPRGKELLGPVDSNVKRKKFVQSFSGAV
jgi:ribosomal protein L14